RALGITPLLARVLPSLAGPAKPDAQPSGACDVWPAGCSLHARLERDADRPLHRAPRSAESGSRGPPLWWRGRPMAPVEMPTTDSPPGLASRRRSGPGSLSVAQAAFSGV